MASIVLDRVTLERGGIEILHDLSLRVDHAELLVIVGPSGSGKSSVLRAIAGLDPLARGEILFDGVDVTRTAPAQRDVAMVFQDDALYPFMTVRRNVSFPLKVRRVPADEIEDRVTAETRMLAIDRFLERLPRTLAAGHQQLVQAARALVRNPAVFLLDEPLARMDAESRQTVRSEIALLQRGYGVTMVYATNDQEQAMALGDRLAVLDGGRIRQIGPPGDVYSRPDDTFVAGFVGSPPMSFLPGRLVGMEVTLEAGALPMPRGSPSGDVTVGVRPHDWEVSDVAGLPATVIEVEHHGSHSFATVSLGSDQATVRCSAGRLRPGEDLQLWTRRFHVFSRADGRAIAHVG